MAQTQGVTLSLPADFPPAALEALERFVTAVTDRHTGNWSVDMSEGIPGKGSRTEHFRFGKTSQRS